MMFGSERGILKNAWINISCFAVMFDLVLKRYGLRVGWEGGSGFQELHVVRGFLVEKAYVLGSENRLGKEFGLWKPLNV